MLGLQALLKSVKVQFVCVFLMLFIVHKVISSPSKPHFWLAVNALNVYSLVRLFSKFIHLLFENVAHSLYNCTLSMHFYHSSLGRGTCVFHISHFCIFAVTHSENTKLDTLQTWRVISALCQQLIENATDLRGFYNAHDRPLESFRKSFQMVLEHYESLKKFKAYFDTVKHNRLIITQKTVSCRTMMDLKNNFLN